MSRNELNLVFFFFHISSDLFFFCEGCKLIQARGLENTSVHRIYSLLSLLLYIVPRGFDKSFSHPESNTYCIVLPLLAG